MEDKSRNRFIVCSRQVGKTRTMAREAFFDAIENARDQIFLSASKRQSFIFRNYIKKMSQDEFGVKLTGGDEITIETSKGVAVLYFVSPNVIYSQGFSGNLYVDEAAWLRNYAEVMKVARPIATVGKFRTTESTTPSSMGHAAFPVWEGLDKHGERKPRDEFGNILGKSGRVALSRHQITMPEAMEMGYTMVDEEDWEDMNDQYSPDEIKQLFLGSWIDEKGTLFKLSELEKCQRPADEMLEMLDGRHPMYFGYDPSRTRDHSSFSGIEFVPDMGVYRRIFGERYMNLAARHQAQKIMKKLLTTPSAEFLGLDTSGFGQNVGDELKLNKNYPSRVHLKEFFYSRALKEQLILNTQRLVEEGKFHYSEEDTRLTSAFLSIKKVLTHSGEGITYRADRSAETGHADDFFSTAHGLWPALGGHRKRVNKGFMVRANRMNITA